MLCPICHSSDVASADITAMITLCLCKVCEVQFTIQFPDLTQHPAKQQLSRLDDPPI
jgi:transcription elongation factor Elf1